MPQPDRPQFPRRRGRPDSNATALARLIFALIHRQPVRQTTPPRDRAEPRERADVDLAWKYMEDSRRSDRIFQTNFREDRFFESELARVRVGPRFHARAPVHHRKRRSRTPLPPEILQQD